MKGPRSSRDTAKLLRVDRDHTLSLQCVYHRTVIGMLQDAQSTTTTYKDPLLWYWQVLPMIQEPMQDLR